MTQSSNLVCCFITTKSGSTILLRSFHAIPHSNLETLPTAFDHLIKPDKQHTVIEYENGLRFYYLSIHSFYLVLVGTSASDPVSSLATLDHIQAVILPIAPTKEQILSRVYEIIFSIDEIIYQDVVDNSTSVETLMYLAMESHEELIQNIIRKNKEYEAKEIGEMYSKNLKSGLNKKYSPPHSSLPPQNLAPTYSVDKPLIPQAKGTPSGLKLSHSAQKPKYLVGKDTQTTKKPITIPQRPNSTANVVIYIDETIETTMLREGGVEKSELHGEIYILLNTPLSKMPVCHLAPMDTKEIQLRSHPNINKKLLQDFSIALKDGQTYPIGQKVSILKWRMNKINEDQIPILLSLWPSDSTNGICVVVEYQVQRVEELLNVIISIPITSEMAPMIDSVDGVAEFDRKSGILQWKIANISEKSNNLIGEIRFETSTTDQNTLYPIEISFESKTIFSPVVINSVEGIGDMTSEIFCNLVTGSYLLV